jgi:hypothetical protein
MNNTGGTGQAKECKVLGSTPSTTKSQTKVTNPNDTCWNSGLIFLSFTHETLRIGEHKYIHPCQKTIKAEHP